MRRSGFAEPQPEDLPCGHTFTHQGCVPCTEWDATHEADEIVEVYGMQGRGVALVKTREGRKYHIRAADVPNRAYPQVGHLITRYKAQEVS